MNNQTVNWNDLAGSLIQSFESFLSAEIQPALRSQAPADLAEVISYALLAPGKRLRPVLCLQAAGFEKHTDASGFKMGHGPEDQDWHQACMLAASAVECIHAYSLIHDDLPAMDDDDLRRGQPTVHRQFNEWKAILAGDALNTYAFYLLTEMPDSIPDDQQVEIHRTLARAAGISGMVGGQYLDLLHEKSGDQQTATLHPLSELEQIHALKTAALIEASIRIGAILAGYAPEKQELSARYGRSLGLLFQITDDVLDVTSQSAEMGKATGKDEARGKWTYPALLGLEKSREWIQALVSDLQKMAAGFDQSANHEFWVKLPAWIATRRH
ncbi:MAG: polyprenyl synthetase family protein [Leptospiraceae bacterium]|nr:polyprenyl synthetase family protein [Leptospiraceae bacterium]